MADDETGKKGGQSYTGKYDTETKTARPGSVGPHGVTREQEDPGDKGIDPQSGYANEIETANASTPKQPAKGAEAVIAPQPKTETVDESGGTEELLKKSGPARDAPPLSGMAQE
jgi:hypothetical protein